MVATNDKNSYGGIIEYSWVGTSPEDVNVSIDAIGAHFQIVQIAFNFDGANTGSESEEFTATTNHIESSRIDTEIFAQNMLGLGGVLQRWNNNAGPYIPKGSAVDFAFENGVEGLSWGLSVMVRAE